MDRLARTQFDHRPPPAPPARSKAWPAAGWLLAVVLAAVAAGGCASAKMAELRSVPKSPLTESLHLASRGGPRASARTAQFLRVYALPTDLKGNPRKLLDRVQEIIERDPSAEKVYAFTELAFLEAKKAESHDPDLALDLYGAAAVHAYQYLFDARFRPLRNPYDPEFRGACDLYNGALESTLRLARQQHGLRPGQTYTIRTASGTWDINCALHGGKWRPEDFDRFEFVSDYEINGLRNHYQTYGLGVPLIAVRRSYQGEPEATRYYPPGLSFPVTAFLRPMPGPDQDRANTAARHLSLLELYDSVSVSDIAVDDLTVPLETDLTTPLAWFLSNPDFSRLPTAGLLRPETLFAMRRDQKTSIMGLWMVQPYEPGKIPVLMVHGLWSSPMTWMEMFNDLRSSSVIRDHYQFWFYLYPTAQPFWLSAAQLRKDLADARRVLDPEHREPALDEMVLIGHSMGGLVSRLQTMDSRDDFWKAISQGPIDQLKADPRIRQQIADCFFFQPNPSIRRVITIATPHRGSRASNDTTQWLSAKFIRLPKMFADMQFYADNKALIRDDRLLKIDNSVESLAPDDPFFPVMQAAYRAPWVKYNNIVGLVPDHGLTGYLAKGTDGVVSFQSAHLDEAESELVVEANHAAVQSNPRAVLEVRRILLDHLAEAIRAPETELAQARSADWR